MSEAHPQSHEIPSPALFPALLAVMFASFALYVMALDNGMILQALASQVHEFLHDGRHFLGVPCH